MGRKRLGRQGLLAGLAVVATMLATGAQAAAEPGNLPAGVDVGQFYPTQADFPEGWSLGGQSALAVPAANSTTPAGCGSASLFLSGSARVATGPDGSALRVRLALGSDGLQTVRSWAEKCSSFTMLGGGGTTGKNWMSVQEAASPGDGALAYRVTGQGPFTPPELVLAGSVRGALVLVAQLDPAEGDSTAAQVYRATAAKINAWRG